MHEIESNLVRLTAVEFSLKWIIFPTHSHLLNATNNAILLSKKTSFPFPRIMDRAVVEHEHMPQEPGSDHAVAVHPGRRVPPVAAGSSKGIEGIEPGGVADQLAT